MTARRLAYVGRATRAFVAFAALGLGVGNVVVQADGAGGADASGVRGFEARIFDVGSLTAGFTHFGSDHGLAPVIVAKDADGHRTNAQGVFGWEFEGEARLRPFGTIDDVIEAVVSGHGAPFPEGVRLAALGPDRLLFVGPHALAEEASSTLEALERALPPVVALDVLALRGEAPMVVDGDVGAALARGDLVPLAGTRVTGAGAQAESFVGAYDAFVAAEDAVVAVRERSLDPVVAIARRGLAVRARFQGARGERVLTWLRASWARPDAFERREVGAEHDPVETTVVEERSFEGLVELPPEVWRLFPSTGDVAFAARVSLLPRGPRRPPASAPFAVEAIADAGPVELRSHSVLDLGARVWHTTGFVPMLWPSGYLVPKAPDLREALGAVPAESLVETVGLAVDPPTWRREGRSIDLKNGTLYVRTDEAHDRAVSAFLDALRATSLRSTRLRATEVRLPLASMSEYLAGLGDGAGVLRDGVRGLLARAGTRVTGKAALVLRDGQRLDTTAGTWRSYVADLDPVIAEAAYVGDPIVRSVFEGVVFDASLVPVLDGSEVLVDLRWSHSAWLGSRTVPTSMGEIECPSLGLARTRGAVSIPRGGARVVGAALDGGEVTLTILEVSP